MDFLKAILAFFHSCRIHQHVLYVTHCDWLSWRLMTNHCTTLTYSPTSASSFAIIVPHFNSGAYILIEIVLRVEANGVCPFIR